MNVRLRRLTTKPQPKQSSRKQFCVQLFGQSDFLETELDKMRPPLKRRSPKRGPSKEERPVVEVPPPLRKERTGKEDEGDRGFDDDVIGPSTVNI